MEHSDSNEVLIALRQIIQAIDLHSRSLVRQYGLTGPQLVILQELSNHNELSVGELARAISLGQATVTGILTRLEKRKLITKKRSNVDKRRVHIEITEECRQLLKSAPPLLQETFCYQFERLQNWEQNMIISSLQRIVSMMDAKSIEAFPILMTGEIEHN
ncbi:MarR family transcriptional regulator [Candidatus Magnetomoraceae bacterium gMMP-15]